MSKQKVLVWICIIVFFVGVAGCLWLLFTPHGTQVNIVQDGVVMLDERGKHVYRQIYANVSELYSAFSLVEPVTAGELKNIFSAVVNDHPELFWLETAYAGKYVRNGQCVEIDLRFNRTAQNLESAKAYFNENADQIIAGAQNYSGKYEKERFVHDALLDRISYNLGAEMNQSAYSALVNGQTVCAGYARAFQYILQQLGIPCYYYTGYAGGSHAWNIVVLDDGYYNVDTTWDDTGNGTYDYFNKTDADYARICRIVILVGRIYDMADKEKHLQQGKIYLLYVLP